MIGVRVGRADGSAARYFLEGQEEIDDLLEHLVAARPSRERAPETTPRSRGRTAG